MTEHAPHNPTPEQAHDRVLDAITFAEASGASGLNRMNRDVTTGIVSRAEVKVPDTELTYADTDALREEDDQSTFRMTHTQLKVPQGSYYSQLVSGDAASGNVSVGRRGYRHRFNRENEQKAAALVTSIAARHIGKHVLGHTDKVAQAKETYLNKINPGESAEGMNSPEAESPDFMVRRSDLVDFAASRKISPKIATKAWTTLFVKGRQNGYPAERWQQSGLRVIEIPDAASDEERYALSGASLREALDTGTIDNLYDFGDVTKQFAEDFMVAKQDAAASPTSI